MSKNSEWETLVHSLLKQGVISSLISSTNHLSEFVLPITWIDKYNKESTITITKFTSDAKPIGRISTTGENKNAEEQKNNISTISGACSTRSKNRNRAAKVSHIKTKKRNKKISGPKK